jgi:hypothetical protein
LLNIIVALESLVESLRSHQDRLEQSLKDRSHELAQCRAEILQQQEVISDLRSQLSRATEAVWNKESQDRALEIHRLREEIGRLERECIYLRGCVEKGLASINDNRASSNAYNSVPVPVPVPVASDQVYGIASRMTPVVEVTEPNTSQGGNHQSQRQPLQVSLQDPVVSRAAATIGERTARDTMFVQVNPVSHYMLNFLSCVLGGRDLSCSFRNQ